jgi:flagellar hook protein FlgE
MSIYGALYSAASGLNAQSEALGTISDNISNVDTIGYKSTEEQFSTLVTLPATSTTYTPGGVIGHPQQLIDQQGLLQASSNPTALAISGQGFFVVNTNANNQQGNFMFTRAGDFAPDANGNLVNSAGYYLQGFATNANGVVLNSNVTTTSSLTPVNVKGLSGTAAPTANITIAANLPAADTVGTAHTITAQVFDSLGQADNLQMTFTKTGSNAWSLTLPAGALTNATTGLSAGTASLTSAGTITFNSDGTLNTGGAQTISLTALTDGAANGTIALNLGTAGTTTGLSQLSNNFTLTTITQDGRAFGNLTGITINQTGLVTATFSNGQTRPFSQVPLAMFPGPDFLAGATGNAYLATSQSGSFLLQTPGAGGAGTVQSGSLEQSTVDLAKEFSNMIVVQRAYSAAARVVTTADQMLQRLDQVLQ